MQYCFGFSANRTLAADFDPEGYNGFIKGLRMGHIIKHNYWLLNLLQSLPERLAAKLAPAYGAYVAEKKVITSR